MPYANSPYRIGSLSLAALVAVGVGAALGAWLRWALSLGMNAWLPSLPLGTLAANLIGGYLVGVAVEVLGVRAGLPPEMRLFAITGFLGGLTTFSTFSAEAAGLLLHGQWAWAAALIASHVVGSIALTFAGIATVRALLV
jgi:CrcB protein